MVSLLKVCFFLKIKYSVSTATKFFLLKKNIKKNINAKGLSIIIYNNGSLYNDYRVATLSNSYPTVIRNIMQSLKSIGKF